MDADKKIEREPIPESFDSIDELLEFWDGKSTADYEDMMEPVEFDIDLDSSKTYFSVSKSVYALIRQHARKQGVPAETLANLWLQEKALEVAAEDESHSNRVAVPR